MVATLLWAMDILPKVDEHGNPIVPSANDFVDRGIVTCVFSSLPDRLTADGSNRSQSTSSLPMYDQTAVPGGAVNIGGDLGYDVVDVVELMLYVFILPRLTM